MHFDVLVGGLVAVDHDLVTGLPLRHALADPPDDPGSVGPALPLPPPPAPPQNAPGAGGPADVVAPIGVIAVAEHGNWLPERRPDVVEVDSGRHHSDDHLEGAGLGELDLLELKGVLGLAL